MGMKKILCATFLVLLIGSNASFGYSYSNPQTRNNMVPQNYGYIYGNNGTYTYNQQRDFIRTMYYISKMAEQNPGVKYTYTSTTVNHI